MIGYRLGTNDKIIKIKLEEAFPFLKEKGHVISLVGGGGKTTLMNTMADFASRRGFCTLVTTTTHIGIPEDGRYAATRKDVERLWEKGNYAVVGLSDGDHKLSMLPQEQLSEYMHLADTILIEADGAKRLPCKVPREHEPVLLPESDVVIGVMGADTLGNLCGDVCFCLEKMKVLMEIDEKHRMTGEDMAKILASLEGTRKNVGDREYYPVVNKCDRIDVDTQGIELLRQMKKYGLERAVLTTCREEVYG